MNGRRGRDIYLPVVIIVIVTVVASFAISTANDRFAFGDNVTFFGVRGRIDQIALIFDHIGSSDSPFEHLRVEIVRVAQVGKTDHIIDRLVVFDQRQCGHHFYFQPFGQKQRLFGVYFHKSTLHMFASELF